MGNGASCNEAEIMGTRSSRVERPSESASILSRNGLVQGGGSIAFEIPEKCIRVIVKEIDGVAKATRDTAGNVKRVSKVEIHRKNTQVALGNGFNGNGEETVGGGSVGGGCSGGGDGGSESTIGKAALRVKERSDAKTSQRRRSYVAQNSLGFDVDFFGYEEPGYTALDEKKRTFNFQLNSPKKSNQVTPIAKKVFISSVSEPGYHRYISKGDEILAIDGRSVSSVTPSWIHAMLEGATTDDRSCSHRDKTREASFIQDLRDAIPFPSRQKQMATERAKLNGAERPLVLTLSRNLSPDGQSETKGSSHNNDCGNASVSFTEGPNGKAHHTHETHDSRRSTIDGLQPQVNMKTIGMEKYCLSPASKGAAKDMIGATTSPCQETCTT